MASYLHFNKRNYGLQTEEICTDDVGRTWTKAIKTEYRQIYTKQLKEQQRFQRVFGRKKILALFKFVLFFFKFYSDYLSVNKYLQHFYMYLRKVDIIVIELIEIYCLVFLFIFVWMLKSLMLKSLVLNKTKHLLGLLFVV